MADLRRIIAPVANLRSKPSGPLDRQLLFGEAFEVSKIQDGWTKGRRPSDGYVGYIRSDHLAGWADPTARVRTMGAHVYPKADIKTVPQMTLPFQAEVTVVGESGEFVELAGGGFAHQQQLQSLAVLEDDFVRTAENYLGVPYLWGGNSQWGIDCSGLISAAMRSVGKSCAADSGEQAETLGNTIPKDTSLTRGDVVFWKGHVGLMWNDTLLLHANGYHMQTALEPLAEAETRIFEKGGGQITVCRRIVLDS